MTDGPLIQLGLIGGNIAASRSPALHELAGRLTGRNVRYERLVPDARGESFEEVFAFAKEAGYRGLNVTYPYKERVVPLVRVENPQVKALGAVNTVKFTESGPVGDNTDYTGFISGYRRVRGEAKPGPVCMIGAGGVGKAIAFALMTLGMERLTIVERDLEKAEALAENLRAAGLADVRVTGEIAEGVAGAAGLVNCTPVGMVGYGGTPVPAALLGGAEWVFDAVYTPVETPFILDATKAGLTIISGYELFFYQGVNSFAIFHGEAIDEAELRAALEAETV
ncbi:shikimate dehydrogenase family protein [Paracoccaceae bacterium GXU_MW_L88]